MIGDALQPHGVALRGGDCRADTCRQCVVSVLREARLIRTNSVARFVLNHCPARAIIARGTAAGLGGNGPPVLPAATGQRVPLANAARSGRLFFEARRTGLAAREIEAPATEIAGIRL